MRRKIGEICEIVSGTTPKTGCPKYWGGKCKWITPAELNDDSYFIYDTERTLTELGVAEAGLHAFPAGTVLLSSRAPIGKVAIAGVSMTCNQGFKNLICKQSVHNRFLYWFLKSQKDYLISLGRGATFKEISKAILADVEMELPSLDKQIEIADQFEFVSSLIMNWRAQLVKLDELIKARFVEMFEGKGHPHHTLSSLIQEGASISYGIVQPGDDGTGDVGIVRPVDLCNGKVFIDSIKYIDKKISNAYKKTELSGDELIITVRGTTGLTALTNHRCAGMNVTRGIAVIRYDKCKINPVYLNSYFNTDDAQHYIQEHTKGATLRQINLSDLRIQQVLVPPLEEQDSFAAFVEQVDKSKVAVQKALDKAQQLYDSLMQQYFD